MEVHAHADGDAELRRSLLDPADGARGDGHDHKDELLANERHMGALGRLALSPWEKWRRHGRFPAKPALHAALLVLTAAQLALYGAQNAAYMRASHRNWAYFFLPPPGDLGTVARYQREVYSVNDTLAAVWFMRDAYFSVVDASVANYEYLLTPDGDVEPFHLSTTRRLPHGALDTREYSVGPLDEAVGPFDPRLPAWQRQQLVRSLRRVEFAFALRDRQYGSWYEECFEWRVHASLTVVQGAHVHAQLEDCELSRCRSRKPVPLWSAARQGFLWLHLLIAALCMVYAALSIKALRRSARMVAKARQLLRPRAERPSRPSSDDAGDAPTPFESWEDVPTALKLKLLNSMQMLVLVALILLLASSLWSLLSLKAHVPIRFGHRLLHATALLLLWSAAVGYLSHNRNVYSIVLTLKWGAPRVLQFLLGVSPIFLGFALFGTVYFGGKINMFGSLSASTTTLFAIMNGDAVLDTFDAMELHGFHVSGKAYLYAFISLFIYVVLNIFIAIVEEAFFATRSTRRTLSVLLSDPQLSRAQAAQEDEVSAEMLRLLLQAMEAEDEGRRER